MKCEDFKHLQWLKDTYIWRVVPVLAVNAHSRWHYRPFVWIEADKEKTDKVMFSGDNF